MTRVYAQRGGVIESMILREKNTQQREREVQSRKSERDGDIVWSHISVIDDSDNNNLICHETIKPLVKVL